MRYTDEEDIRGLIQEFSSIDGLQNEIDFYLYANDCIGPITPKTKENPCTWVLNIVRQASK